MARKRGEQFLAEVRTWIGTPFVPQQASKANGCDCKGLLWGAARELGFPEAQTPYAEFVHYNLGRRNGIPSALLKEGMAALFDRVDEPEPGDMMLISRNGKAMHLAVCSGSDKAIHAQLRSKAWVTETPFRVLLHNNKLDSVWRWRDG